MAQSRIDLPQMTDWSQMGYTVGGLSSSCP